MLILKNKPQRFPKESSKGFTIVELLIVIVVIAILATISIVAYTGIQQRARDTQRKNDLAQIAKALQIYYVDSGNHLSTGSGCGASGNGGGVINSSYSGYTRVIDCLIESKALSGELKDPLHPVSCSSGSICRWYMKSSTCGSGTYLYASLESESAGQDGPTNGTCNAAWDTDYGMNYVVKVN